MLYKSRNVPDENEFVICTVKKVLPHSVFVTLNEYGDMEAMIHISEVSPGRIRNIRDFVREGKIIVCKVLRLHRDKGHIDLSLRRVSRAQKRKKEEDYKQEQKSQKLITLFCKENKLTFDNFYKKLGEEIIREFGSFTNFFNGILADEKDAVSGLEGDAKLLESLIKKIKEKIKLPEVKLDSMLSIVSKEGDGIERIKNTFKKTETFVKQKGFKIKLSYVSAPKYSLQVKANDYKTADKILKEVSDTIVSIAEKEGCEAEWQKKS